ncbi:DUF962-domain-containing protein [Fistulina hepatica ATCC 64428]|uniref:DUF962-domain-containing protein n=1 Tax=Fistulina hepatica ATCC 64428 TaxID=1128425 RepID=A0A0D7A5B8_9AGAR|nr:DUF962-domain-containing protein [Fistulina hepatica ATCC 64428]
MPSDLLNIDKQLAFYGAYHSNKVNVLIHMVFVPVLVWTWQVMSSSFPVPSFIPGFRYEINDYMTFDLNIAAIYTGLYLVYYFMLDPVSALLYLPQIFVSLTTAIAYCQSAHDHAKMATYMHLVSWLFQFAGHAFAEKRSPALLDNFIGAVVLAPFFVHLELLFLLFGYRKDLQKRVHNLMGVEIAKFRRGKAEKARAKEE